MRINPGRLREVVQLQQLGGAAYEIRSFDDVDFAHKLVKIRAVRR